MRHTYNPSHFLNALLTEDDAPAPDDSPPLGAARGCLLSLLPALLLWAVLLGAVAWLTSLLLGVVGVAVLRVW